MEFLLSFSPIIASIFFVIVCAFLLHKKRDGKDRAPPQAKGAWPIIGHLHLLGGSRLPPQVFSDMADKSGPIFTIKLGVHQALVVNSREIAKECLTTNDKSLASRPKLMAVELMAYNNAIFVASPYGDYWRQVRKVVTQEMLSSRRVEMFGCFRISEVKASMNYIYEAWVINKQNEGSQMVKVDMKKVFGNMILNVMLGIIAGKRFPLDNEEGVRFHNVVKKFFELLGAFVLSDFIPFVKSFDFGGYEKEMKMTAKEMDSFFEGWLEEHKKKKESGQQHEGNQSFMDVLISVLQDASKDEYPGFDHDTVIKATCQGILIAGTDTTFMTLTWAFSLLLNNPKALEIAQGEIDEHVGRERLVEESDLKNLVYLEAIIKETMRLYPAAPLAAPRESIEDCIISGYKIPKGTRLFINIWKIHHDPNIWSDPYEFRPERFMTDQMNIDIKGNNFEWIPFGSGRRMCSGNTMALKTLRLTLATLLQQFVFKKPSDEPIDMTEGMGLTSIKVKPVEVLVAPRLSLNMYA